MEKYTYEELLEIVARLRAEDGCPWDRAQTHDSLRPCMMEEAAEAVAAVRILNETGDPENLKEELGDVLLQVVMHARIAQEEGLFTIEDVVDGIAAKMVRRHPHVFGDAGKTTTGEIQESWEEIKKREKAGRKEAETPLREIPRELPALTLAVKVLKKVDKLYEPQPDFAEVCGRLQELAEILGKCTPETCDEQISGLTGDMLLTLSQISRLCRLPQEQILSDRLEEIAGKWEP